MDRALIVDLAERVGRATGPDRKLDADLALATGWRNGRYLDGGVAHMAFLQSHPTPTAQADIADEMSIPAYTASIDAALALVERVLPGWHWLARNGHASGCFASVRPADSSPNEGGPVFYGKAPTAPLAILAALLEALPSDGAPHAG